MKHNYNFRVDPPMPSEEQIAKHKDFDAVLKRYEQVVPQLHRKPLYKNPKAFLSLTLAGVIGFLVFQAVREEEKAAEPTQPVATEQAALPAAIVEAEANAFLAAPIPGAAPVLHQLAVSADQTAMMRLADGSTIEVPKDAFETMDGRPVQGDVQVSVRVLRDPLDHVLAGLPLRDAEGRSFVTGASVEVSAGQGKHPLRLRPGTQVRIQLQVPKGAPSSELMHLDTEKRHWTAVPGARLETVAQQGGAPTRTPSDGFGVVEFGPDGKPIHKQAGTQGSEPKVQQFVQVVEVAALGRYSLRSGMASADDKSLAVRLTDASGQPQQVFALHRVAKGGQDAKALASYFPISAQFDYTLHWNSAQAAVFFGFLPDGRVAYGSSAELSGLQPKAPWVMQVSPAPIKNKSDLVQLLGI